MFRKLAVSLNAIKSVCNPIVSPVPSRFSFERHNSSYVESNDKPKILITGKCLNFNLNITKQMFICCLQMQCDLQVDWANLELNVQSYCGVNTVKMLSFYRIS